MNPLLFPLDSATSLTKNFLEKTQYEEGKMVIHTFPDDETSIRIDSDVKDRVVILLATLDRPNDKIIPLYFAAETARALGAAEVGLVAPYLAYMRQDTQFHPGEGVSAKYFAGFLSQYFDWLITIDPHLHRFHSLSDIYTISTTVLHAVGPIADWIAQQVDKPLIIGPDEESEQWVANIAQKINAPYITLKKTRNGDRSIMVMLPSLERYKNYTPVLVDDIIASGNTMIEPLKQLKLADTKSPICIGVHAVFAGSAYEDLLKAGATKVVTCNTIQHVSNGIDVSSVIAQALDKW